MITRYDCASTASVIEHAANAFVSFGRAGPLAGYGAWSTCSGGPASASEVSAARVDELGARGWMSEGPESWPAQGHRREVRCQTALHVVLAPHVVPGGRFGAARRPTEHQVTRRVAQQVGQVRDAAAELQDLRFLDQLRPDLRPGQLPDQPAVDDSDVEAVLVADTAGTGDDPTAGPTAGRTAGPPPAALTSRPRAADAAPGARRRAGAPPGGVAAGCGPGGTSPRWSGAASRGSVLRQALELELFVDVGSAEQGGVLGVVLLEAPRRPVTL